MSDDKTSNSEADFKKILDQFPDSEKPGIGEVWQKSRTVSRPHTGISAEEADTALENLHHRIDELQENENPQKKQKWIFLYSRYLIAALALIVFGIGYMMVPVSYTVPNTETAIIEFPDGSVAELNSGSTIQYSRLFSLTGRDVTLNGEAYFDVETGESPFRIYANSTVTEVLGTEFNIRSWNTDPNQKTELYVSQGKVQFYPEGDRQRFAELTAGQKAAWDVQMVQPETTDATDEDSYTAWRENRMVFRETPFIVIINELERRFDVEIRLEARNMEMEPLTAYYTSPAGVESILEDICLVKGLNYTETTSGYRIFK